MKKKGIRYLEDKFLYIWIMKKVFLFLLMLFTVSISYAVVQTNCKEKKNLDQTFVAVSSPTITLMAVQPILYSWLSQEYNVIVTTLYKETLNKENFKVSKAERKNLPRQVTT